MTISPSCTCRCTCENAFVDMFLLVCVCMHRCACIDRGVCVNADVYTYVHICGNKRVWMCEYLCVYLRACFQPHFRKSVWDRDDKSDRSHKYLTKTSNIPSTPFGIYLISPLVQPYTWLARKYPPGNAAASPPPLTILLLLILSPSHSPVGIHPPPPPPTQLYETIVAGYRVYLQGRLATPKRYTHSLYQPHSRRTLPFPRATAPAPEMNVYPELLWIFVMLFLDLSFFFFFF